MTGRFVSECCGGERCWCGQLAEHAVEEVIFHDDPRTQPQEITPYPGAKRFVVYGAHPLTAYLCHAHFREIMGPAADAIGAAP